MRKKFPLVWLSIIILTASYLASVSLLVGLPDCSYAASAQARCTFCQIIAGQEPATVIYETPEIVVIKKRHAVQGIDCLIIPKKHIVNMKDLKATDPYDTCIMNHIKDCALELSKMITRDGDFSLSSNNGKDANQTVFHMHWHFKAPKSAWKPTVKMTHSPQ